MLDLSFRLFRRPRFVLGTTALALTLYYVLGFAFRPEALALDGMTLGELVWVLAIDQYLVECLTTTITFALVIGYARLLALTQVRLNVPGVLRFNVAFVPLVLTAFFVINPVTQTTRFLLRYGFSPDWSLYWAGYGYSAPLLRSIWSSSA
ncbi:MAG TPA: hypothetical protein VKP65_24065 [Rhodothermales bacterium]|nr:hypothetical protein [Rhodothermales bacterium]